MRLTFPFATLRKMFAKMEESVWMDLERDFTANVSRVGQEKRATWTLTNVVLSLALTEGYV